MNQKGNVEFYYLITKSNLMEKRVMKQSQTRALRLMGKLASVALVMLLGLFAGNVNAQSYSSAEIPQFDDKLSSAPLNFLNTDNAIAALENEIQAIEQGGNLDNGPQESATELKYSFYQAIRKNLIDGDAVQTAIEESYPGLLNGARARTNPPTTDAIVEDAVNLLTI